MGRHAPARALRRRGLKTLSVEVLTFGCRLNAEESEALRGEAEASGQSDLLVVNTCAVTAEAGRQARQAIRRAARDRPGARIVVTGCGAQVETGAYAAIPEVAHLVGNDAKLRRETWAALGPGAPRLALDDIMAIRTAALPRQAADQRGGLGRTRALVPVQTGCDHRCTFCVIPFGRGNSRSVPMEAVIGRVRALTEAGSREVVLTGVDLTAWGRDLGGEDPGEPRLGGLVKAVLRAVPDLPRLRLSSIDSVEADDDLLDALATEPRLMPHLHLSLQSGDDLVLKRMRRRHARADAVAFCDRVRRLRPDLVLGADLIAGFPTESEAMFRNSLALIEECGLAHLHVFPYSPRPGTPAARMPAVPGPVIRERAARLREAGQAAFQRHLAGEVGTRRRVLVERGGLGRTEGFAPVRFSAAPPAGTLAAVDILGQDGRALIAA